MWSLLVGLGLVLVTWGATAWGQTMHPLSPAGDVPTTTAVELRWQPHPDAVRYAVRATDATDPAARLPGQECTGTGGTTLYLCLNAVPAPTVVMPVTPGHSYGFWVHPVLATGAFGASDGASFRVLAAAPPPSATLTQGATVFAWDSTRALGWTWTQGTGSAADGFRIRCGSTPGGAKPTAQTVGPTVREVNLVGLLGLTARGTFVCEAAAFNAAGEGVGPETSLTIADLPVVIVPAAPSAPVVK